MKLSSGLKAQVGDRGPHIWMGLELKGSFDNLHFVVLRGWKEARSCLVRALQIALLIAYGPPWLVSIPPLQAAGHTLVPLPSGQHIFLMTCFLGGSIGRQLGWWIPSPPFSSQEVWSPAPSPPYPSHFGIDYALSLCQEPRQPASCRRKGQLLSTFWNVAPPSGSLRPDSATVKFQ